MTQWLGRSASAIASLLAVLLPSLAMAQEEIKPPSGKGPLVVVLSGSGGAGSIRDVAVRIAALGYDVALFDSNAIVAAKVSSSATPVCSAVINAIARARQSPNALPGAYGIVGFSLGGGMAFSFGCPFTDPPAVVAAWYPVTDNIKNVPAFASRLRIPTVMFAGTADDYKFCCMIGKAREIAQAASAVNAPFQLTEYKGAQHAFAQAAAGVYDKSATDDALAKTAAALKRYLGG